MEHLFQITDPRWIPLEGINLSMGRNRDIISKNHMIPLKHQYRHYRLIPLEQQPEHLHE